MGDAAQILEGMSFFAYRVGFCIVDYAMNYDLAGLNFPVLSLSLRGNQGTCYRNRAACTNVDNLLIINQLVVRYRLHGAKT